MNTYSYDTFEDEIEISQMVSRLQAEGLKYMMKPDIFDIQNSHELSKVFIQK